MNYRCSHCHVNKVTHKAYLDTWGNYLLICGECAKHYKETVCIFPEKKEKKVKIK